MKTYLRVLPLVLLIASASPATARAAGQSPVPAATTAAGDELGAARKRWSEMSEQDRQKIRDNYRKWQGLPPQKKQELIDRFKRFQSLSPETKQRILKNYESFEKLPPEQREKIRQRFEKFKQLPPEERKKRLEALRKRREAMKGKGKSQEEGSEDASKSQLKRRWQRK
jgi:hypothetical protein